MYRDIKPKSPNVKYNDMITHLSESTGMSRQTISKTIAEYNRTKTVGSPNQRLSTTSPVCNINDLDHDALREKVHSIWLRRELPTFDNVLAEVNQDPSLPVFKRSSMYNAIKRSDFIFTKMKKSSVLIEREEVILWRRDYLNDIRKYREEGRPVYYLDETWLNSSDCVEPAGGIGETARSEHGGCNTGPGRRLVMLHVGSDRGFLPEGLFMCFESEKPSADRSGEMSGDDFKEWFQYILPRLDPNSVVVMDNAPHHNSVKAEMYPTACSRKSEILEWLNSRGVTFDRPLLKAQLLMRVGELKSRDNVYVVDNLARDAGHTVLRLPPNHRALNPIELAWPMVKGHVKRQNSAKFEIDDVRLLLNAGVGRVTAGDWRDFIKRVIEEENKMWEVDEIIDELIDETESYYTGPY